MLRFQTLSIRASFDHNLANTPSDFTDADFVQSTRYSTPLGVKVLAEKVLRFTQRFQHPARPEAAPALPDEPPAYDAINPNQASLTRTNALALKLPFCRPLTNVKMGRENVPANGPHDIARFSAAVAATGKLESWVSESALTGIFNGVSAGLVGLGVAKIAALAVMGPVLGSAVVIGGGTACRQAQHILSVRSDYQYLTQLTDILRNVRELGVDAIDLRARLEEVRLDSRDSDERRAMFIEFAHALMLSLPDQEFAFVGTWRR